jgi:hypothetical protein
VHLCPWFRRIPLPTELNLRRLKDRAIGVDPTDRATAFDYFGSRDPITEYQRSAMNL